MDPAGIPALQDAIRHMHGCASTWIESVPVTEMMTIGPHTRPVWQGEVQIFDLVGHPTARRAYAWSHETENGSGRRRFVAVLHAGPVVNAVTAVRAAIAAG
jgi:hypothetical protein|nr:hypothetical protein [Kofleriaceae bacterium]